MVADKNQIDPEWLAERGAMFRQVRSDSLLLVLPLLVVSGLLLGSGAYTLSDPLLGVLVGLWFGMLAVIVGFLRPHKGEAAAWTLVVAGVAGILLAAIGMGHYTAFVLLALPAGIALLLLGPPAGLGVAGLISLMVPAMPAGLLSAEVRLVTLWAIWCTLGLVWLATRPLRITGQLAWSSYQRSQQLLEQSRDFQLKLQQTLDDLTFANQHLERLNRLANGLRQAEEEARRAKEQFVANVSHELRTPLNMIIGFTEMIVNTPATYHVSLPAALLADLTVVLRNSQHLASLVDDVLDLSQIEAGRMALTKERVQLREIAEEAVTAVQPLYESKGLYLRKEIEADLPPILADPTRMREVLLNLLSNAGRFTQSGGVTVSLTRRGQEIVASVADSGPGIEAAAIDRMFQPFQQLDTSIRKKFGGTGLGLTISRSFVDMHGGRMWVESTIGRGTTFFFSLPLSTQEAALPGALQWLNADWPYYQRTHVSAAPPAPAQPRLLLCDSGSTLHRLLTRYLSKMDVVQVPDMAAAEKELVQTPAQAVVYNSRSLEEAAAHLSACPPLPYNTPILACAVPSTPQDAGVLGVSDYLLKPISRQTLLDTLKKLNLAGCTILVVDDEPESLRLFRRILSAPEPGYRVLTARNGWEALAVLHEQQPDCILMDLVMPEMDGFQLLAAKEADPVLRDIPVIVISAQDAAGQPILSQGLVVMRGQGLSLQQLLACIQALSTILSPANSPARLAALPAPHSAP